MSHSAPFLSVVVPAYNEGQRLPKLLSDLAALGIALPSPPVELLVVDDGSAPWHLERERVAIEEVMERLGAAGAPHRIRLIAVPANHGKGAAIRRGWSEADPGAEWLGFMDADGAVPARELWRLASMLVRDGFDLLAGSRIRMAGHVIERKLARHLQGRVFATLAEQLLSNGFYDTQCGLKFARASVLRPRLELLRQDRWLLDLELIAVLKRAGARCLEEPIDWSDPGGSKVVPGIDALRMLFGLWRMKRRLARELGAGGS
jgi:dolichyl-phosphate beta-glucosyltransferase